MVALCSLTVAEALNTTSFVTLPVYTARARTYVAKTESSGLGVFASTDVARGELLFREHPLLVYPQMVPFHSFRPPGEQYPELDDAISKLSATDRQAFFNLANSCPYESSPTKGIIDTNAVHIGLLSGSQAEYAAVCKQLSRVNHSCSPNGHYHFCPSSLSLELRALQPISAHTEVTISYVDPTLPRAARLAALASYAFTCTCPSCSLPESVSPESDARRAFLARTVTDDAALSRWARDPSLPDAMGALADRAYVRACEAEGGLFIEDAWTAPIARLVKACCALEDAPGAREWARRGRELSLAFTGEDGGWAEVERWPERTGWWGLRRRAKEAAATAAL
ncbi:uncharacterized protein BXZ73DRAFT_43312 [Epithele typhae]|uniref:uncharacterized protein n=1 Tax=Epithele typhae TaxID=378194 RepID=UPI002008660F|nr:uncharacterized protein BXZ73DRAFT_43312 [Epithele typhae]KAH9940134.1 hypothetical protein BXZ73DRAFT_43312 [Epithele typhae]